MQSAKRELTPVRKKEDQDSRKRIPTSVPRNQESEDRVQDKKSLAFNRPPISKKPVFNMALEKYKNESKTFHLERRLPLDLLQMIVGKNTKTTPTKKSFSGFENFTTEETKANSFSKNR